jgi:hypothetical protein
VIKPPMTADIKLPFHRFTIAKSPVHLRPAGSYHVAACTGDGARRWDVARGSADRTHSPPGYAISLGWCGATAAV